MHLNGLSKAFHVEVWVDLSRPSQICGMSSKTQKDTTVLSNLWCNPMCLVTGGQYFPINRAIDVISYSLAELASRFAYIKGFTMACH